MTIFDPIMTGNRLISVITSLYVYSMYIVYNIIRGIHLQIPAIFSSFEVLDYLSNDICVKLFRYTIDTKLCVYILVHFFMTSKEG